MQSIEELLKNKPKKSSDAVAEKFQAKMLEINKKEMETATESNARAQGFSYINLKGFPLAQESLLILSREEMVSAKAVCVFQTNKQLKIASADPAAAAFAKLMERVKQDYPFQNIDIFMISENSFEVALLAFDRTPKIKQVQRGVVITEQEILKFQEEVKTIQELSEKIKTVSVSDIFTMILAVAVKAKASDLHFEAKEKEIAVRMRVDGVLHEVARIPKTMWSKVISRIKFLAHLKLNVDTIPQDGKFVINMGATKLDVRVSTLPAVFGESVVFRLLISTGQKLTLETIGLEGYNFEVLNEEINRSFGMIITTGPTGSGKTSTLNTILLKVNSPEVNIITLEDPVEYELEGITQTPIDTKRGMTFAAGLRAVLRQDPDIILVGEIRDAETADAAIQAALTGHIVLSTIHTNSAAGAIPRFLSMGAKPFLLAPALNAMIGQRLVRRICQSCKTETAIGDKMTQRVVKELTPIKDRLPQGVDLSKLTFHSGKGCEACQGIGYKGRVGIYEVLRKTPEIEKMILSGSLSEYAIQEIGIKEGMITMIQDGLIKAVKGVTSPEEVFEAAG